MVAQVYFLFWSRVSSVVTFLPVLLLPSHGNQVHYFVRASLHCLALHSFVQTVPLTSHTGVIVKTTITL